MLCFRGEKHKQMLLWTCLPVGWCTPAPGDLPASRKRAAPTCSTAGFRCWPGHIYTVVKGLSSAFEANLLKAWERERERELGWLILFPTATSSIQVTAWPRTCCLVRGRSLQIPLVPLAQHLQNSITANFRGQCWLYRPVLSSRLPYYHLKKHPLLTI